MRMQPPHSDCVWTRTPRSGGVSCSPARIAPRRLRRMRMYGWLSTRMHFSKGVTTCVLKKMRPTTVERRKSISTCAPKCESPKTLTAMGQ